MRFMKRYQIQPEENTRSTGSAYSAAQSDADSLQFYSSEIPVINESIDRLVARVHTYRKKYEKKVIMLTGCGSGNGTSMIAINLAIALSAAGWKTLLADVDMQKGARYKRIGEKVNKGLSDYLREEASLEEIVRTTNHEKLDYVPSGSATKDAVLRLCSEQMAEFIDKARTGYEYIILDCPSITVVPDASVLLLHVDGVALVAAMNATTKKQLALAKREMEKNPDKYYGIIINCVDKKQYRHFFPQQGYFEEPALRKKHKRLRRRVERAQKNQHAAGLQRTAQPEGDFLSGKGGRRS